MKTKILGGLAAIGLAAALAACGHSASADPIATPAPTDPAATAPPSPSPTMPAPTTPAPAPTTDPPAPVAPPDTAPPITAAQSMADWWNGITVDYDSLHADFTQAGQDAKAGDVSSLDADCSMMADDANKLKADPPVPVAAINAPWQQMLTYSARAATECTNGIENNDTSQIEAATTDLNTADSYLTEATSQINALVPGS